MIMEQQQSQKRFMKKKKECKAFSPKSSNGMKFKKETSSSLEMIKDESPTDGTRKLTKQERRNRNKLLKAGVLPSSQSVKQADASNAEQKASVSSVYKRIPVFPTSYQTPGTDNITDLVDENHPEFHQILETSYNGFHIDHPSDFPGTSFSHQFQSALRELDQLQFYQFDYTQPAGLGTKVARTFVTRCLVGDPGITYKYLGLRMFAHPWTPNAVGANEATVTIGNLNQQLIQRSEELNKLSKKAEYGSSTFNLTLINRCFPEKYENINLKLEPMFEKQYCSVSWHADSSLDHYSTIAVYHFNELNDEPSDGNLKKKARNNAQSTINKPWKAALRVMPNAEGPNQGKPVPANIEVKAPPLVVEMPRECIYYLLDDFNHHHQHSVVAGNTHRYASTHRVSRCEGHTFQYIQKKAQNILNQKFTLEAKKSYIRRLCLVSNEIEFEWIRQFYIQGQKHYDLHQWWHQPMTELLDLFVQIEQKLAKVYQILQLASQPNHLKDNKTADQGKELKSKYRALVPEVTVVCFDEFIEQIEDRFEKRKGWKSREQDPILQDIDANYRPMSCPIDSTNDVWRDVGLTSNETKKKQKKSGNKECDEPDPLMESLLSSLRSLKENYLAKST